MITFRMIEAFRAVVLTGGITRAAGLLNVSQPSVSRLIADLEARLALRLFERRGTRLTTTQAALELLGEVEHAFTGLDRIQHAASLIRSRQRGALTVAAISALGFSILPRALSEFRALPGAPPVRLHIVPSQAALAMLASRQCDLAFTGIPASAEVGRNLAEFDHVGRVILPAGHPLARGAGALGPRDLAGHPMIGLVAGSLPRIATDRAFAEAGVDQHLVLETMQTVSAAQLVQAGLGAAIVDPMTAAVHVAGGGASRAFRPDIPFSFGACCWRVPADAVWAERLVEIVAGHIAATLG
ncbi:LysR substrate-binding domain-containing protein [Humitalea sp. 24SJ18S-53]|uniref:LysR substrate-binding domain-containing protein n=1 Tax=Humitalea sp. 24SJ18S-53 TaxID=3422307 RepID=UPI003D66B80E